jgi:calcineurin-like phosphoesterase family protein
MILKIDINQRVFFTSDTHYAHANICSATSDWKEGDGGHLRKFNSLNEMNDTLVSNINSKVGEDDILFHLGDWSFGGFENIQKFRDRLVCRNIHLILGNHDHHISRNKDGIQDIFSSVQDYLELDLRRYQNRSTVIKHKFVMMHFPIASWNEMSRGRIHLHGHTHLSPKHRVSPGRSMDVGVEGNGLFPIPLEEVLKIMKGRSVANLVLPEDHHVIE